jgi:hypothetical protein
VGSIPGASHKIYKYHLTFTQECSQDESCILHYGIQQQPYAIKVSTWLNGLGVNTAVPDIRTIADVHKIFVTHNLVIHSLYNMVVSLAMKIALLC